MQQALARYWLGKKDCREYKGMDRYFKVWPIEPIRSFCFWTAGPLAVRRAPLCEVRNQSRAVGFWLHACCASRDRVNTHKGSTWRPDPTGASTLPPSRWSEHLGSISGTDAQTPEPTSW